MNRTFLFGFFSILLFSCSRNIEMEKEVIEVPFLINCDKVIHQPGQGVDSKIGTIICDDISFTYDYGLYSNSNPQSMMESFSKSFYAYHYSKFFEAILVDEKLWESFKDSVDIVEVVNEIIDQKYIVNCKDCNATAYLIFNDNTFLYPFILNERIANNHKLFDLTYIRIGDFYKKIYLTNKELSSGVFIGPLGNPRKNRRNKKLNVTTNHRPDAKLKEILESIKLK